MQASNFFKKVFIFTFLVVFAFSVVSCNENPASDVDKTGEKEEQKDPEGKIASEQEEWDDTKTRRLTFSLAKSKDIFYIENISNGSQTISVYYNDIEGVKSNVEVTWDTNLPSNTEIVQSTTSFSFNVNSINRLGDYYITAYAKEGGAKKSYVFSLTSDYDLTKALSYSFISSADVADLLNSDSSRAIVDDKNHFISSIKGIKETDMMGNVIGDSSQRMLLNNEVTYTPTGYNMLLISVKDGISLGEISYEIPEDKDIFNVRTEDNQVLFYIPERLDPFQIKIRAGEKLERIITIVSNEVYTPTLASPLITEISDSVFYEGKVVQITGDGISNETFPTDSNNRIGISVERKPPMSENDEYYAYDWTGQPDTKDIPYGQSIHLRHSGLYRVKSWLVSDGGHTSNMTESTYEVPYYSGNEYFFTNFVAEEKLNTYERWSSYSLDVDNVDSSDCRTNYCVAKIDNSSYYSMTVFKSFEPDSLDPLAVQNRYNELITWEGGKEILSSTDITETLRYAGKYTYSASYSAPGTGYGLVYPTEIPMENKRTVEIRNDNTNRTRDLLRISVNPNVETTLKVECAAFDMPENARIYVAVFNNGSLLSDVSKRYFSFERGDTDAKNYTITERDNLSFMAYMYFTDAHYISGPVRIYKSPTVFFEKTYVLDDDSFQRAENARTLKIFVSKDRTGRYRQTSYSTDNGLSWQSVIPNEGDYYVFEVKTVSPTYIQTYDGSILVRTESTPNDYAQGYTIIHHSFSIKKLDASTVGSSIYNSSTGTILGIFGVFTGGWSLALGKIHLYAWINQSGVVCHYKCSEGSGTTVSTNHKNEVAKMWAISNSSNEYICVYASKKGYISSDESSSSHRSNRIYEQLGKYDY